MVDADPAPRPLSIVAVVVAILSMCVIGVVCFGGRYFPCGPGDFAGPVDETRFEGSYVDDETGTVLLLAVDGTFVVTRSPIGNGPADGFGYPLADGSGAWKAASLAGDSHVELRYETDEPPEDEEVTGLTLAGDPDDILLWDYIGDPDGCELAELTPEAP